MSEENQKLIKEELEYIELKKAGFSKADIKELDRRATENSISYTHPNGFSPLEK